MDAKTLLEILHPDNSTAHWTISDKEIKNTILDALELAAAVEGPEEATPLTDKVCITPIMGNECTPHKWDKLQATSRDLERRMLAALRALKAERERTNNDLLAFKEERERADAAINALEFFKREITKAQEGRT